MNSLKRLFVILLSLCMVLSLTACDKAEPAAETTEATESTEEEGLSFDSSKWVDEHGYYKDVKALDYLTLPEIEKITIPYEDWFATEDEINEEIEVLLQDYAEEIQVTDREVKDGDTVNIDYVGSVDGVEFEGGSTKGAGTSVTIGVTSYIDDFLEQLIGHKPGETIDVNVTFPDPYPNNTELSGKDALFVTKINFITEQKIPELTDEFVQANLKDYYKCENVEGFKQSLNEKMVLSKKSNAIYRYLMTNVEITETPEPVSDYWYNYMEYDLNRQAEYYSMELKTYLTALGYESYKDYYNANIQMAEEYSKKDMIFQALAEEMDYAVSEDDIKAYFLENYGTEDYTLYTGDMSKETIALAIYPSFIMDKLLAMVQYDPAPAEQTTASN